MRQPLEAHVVTISRASGSLTFPAHFQLIAAMNPCPGAGMAIANTSALAPPPPSPVINSASPDQCSNRFASTRAARGGAARDYDKLTDSRLGEPSEKVRSRVETAREKQRLRFLNTGLTCNADTQGGPADVRNFCKLDDAGTVLMRTAMSPLQLSARGFHRVLKLARTIADLADSETIQPAHLAERAAIPAKAAVIESPAHESSVLTSRARPRLDPVALIHRTVAICSLLQGRQPTELLPNV